MINKNRFVTCLTLECNSVILSFDKKETSKLIINAEKYIAQSLHNNFTTMTTVVITHACVRQSSRKIKNTSYNLYTLSWKSCLNVTMMFTSAVLFDEESNLFWQDCCLESGMDVNMVWPLAELGVWFHSCSFCPGETAKDHESQETCNNLQNPEQFVTKWKSWVQRRRHDRPLRPTPPLIEADSQWKIFKEKRCFS